MTLNSFQFLVTLEPARAQPRGDGGRRASWQGDEPLDVPLSERAQRAAFDLRAVDIDELDRVGREVQAADLRTPQAPAVSSASVQRGSTRRRPASRWRAPG